VRRYVLIPLLMILLLTVATTVSAAQDDAVRLGIEPVGSDQHFFDLTLDPGESTELTFRFGNHGEVATRAFVFSADVSTLHGGGMEMADVDDPRTGATEWLHFDQEELDLEPGEAVERTVTLSVPVDTAPGDYITALVIQNAEPVDISDDNGSQFDQTVRQGIAVAIDVPGDREPGLAILGVTHLESGGRSVIEVAVENTGNTHLRPRGTFEFMNAEGEVLAGSEVWLDTVYAGTETVLEVNFTEPLPPGDYLISVALEDEEAGTSASIDQIDLAIAGPEPTPEPVDVDDDGSEDDGGIIGGISTSNFSLSDISPVTLIVVGSVTLISVLIILAALLYNRARRPVPVRQPVRITPRKTEMLQQVPRSSRQAHPARPSGTPPIRQLQPRRQPPHRS
jgi:hypothetical protein